MSQPVHPAKAASIVIRPVAPQDNAGLEALVVDTLTEFGCVGPGFAASDPELKDLYTAYQTPPGQPRDRGYWVIVDEADGLLLGGGGFSRLKGTALQDAVCELQKVYFRPELRGLGFGRKMLERCIEEAALAGYRTMYLETMPQMQSAVGLYEKFGFRFLPTYMGDTGHRSCTVFMSRPLEPAASLEAKSEAVGV